MRERNWLISREFFDLPSFPNPYDFDDTFSSSFTTHRTQIVTHSSVAPTRASG